VTTRADALNGKDDVDASPPWGTLRPGLAARALVAVSRNTPLGRGAFRKAMFRAFARLHPGPADVMLWGTRVRLHPGNNVSERKMLMRPDQTDAREHAALVDAMRAPDCVFVDVGGNAGLYSLHAAMSAGDGGHVLMIEPDRRLIARFAFNLAQAQRAALVRSGVRIETFPVAISDRDGEGVLSAAGEEGSRSLVEGAGAGAQQGTAVTLRTLAGLVRDAGVARIDVMKIDVEGHEDKVLPPFFGQAAEALWPRLIIIEHLQRAQWRPDCIADALQRGYAPVFSTRNNTVLRRA
jgi:FkbM family methyltransferase